MSLHTRMIVGGGLLLVGCGGATKDPAGAWTISGGPSTPVRDGGTEDVPGYCSDCTPPNGPGIYTAEEGHAEIGTDRLLITHFINTTTQVEFDGRYFDANMSRWRKLPHPGRIESAEYSAADGRLQRDLLVTAIHENATVPTWTLQFPAGVTQTVTGPQLASLKLHITFDVPRTTLHQQYVLRFDQGLTEARTRSVTMYNMLWLDVTPGAPTNASFTPYCFWPGGGPPEPGTLEPEDPVVFQEGIDVDPATGLIPRPSIANLVTLSCWHGAPATVYGWGYTYRGSSDETFYFDAGIHMKRASYCADETYYTKTGLYIQIADDRGIQKSITNPDLEAWWQPDGAVCLGKRRYPAKDFSGCPNKPGKLLKPCPAVPKRNLPGGHYLIDAPNKP